VPAVTALKTSEDKMNIYTLLGYLLIGAVVLVVGVVIALTGLWAVGRGISGESFGKWFGLALNTAGLFGWTINESRRFWHARVFWWTTASLLLIHLACFVAILSIVEHWRIVYFVLMYPIELPLIGRTIEWAFDRKQKRSR
jgi:hypothetical protein